MSDFFIAVDFDGTCVRHEFPEIGEEVPGAIEWLKRFQQEGAKIILWTCRSDRDTDEHDFLTQATKWLFARGVKLFGLNVNPSQKAWSSAPKAYAHVYIDDSAIGCPLRPSMSGGRPVVDWDAVGPAVLDMIDEHKIRHAR